MSAVTKKLASFIMLFILAMTPVMSIAAVTQFDIPQNTMLSMLDDSSDMTSKDCCPQNNNDCCSSKLNFCSACTSAIFEPISGTPQQNHFIYSIIFNPVYLSYIATVDNKPPRTYFSSVRLLLAAKNKTNLIIH